MDQLTAYHILGVEPGSSVEEIKEAYALLSKRYHPEEEPERFQEIHDAYVTLTRGRRRGGRTQENVILSEKKEEQCLVDEKKTFEKPPVNFRFEQKDPETRTEERMEERNREEESQFDFHIIETEGTDSEDSEQLPPTTEYAFEDAMQKARQQEGEQLHELTLQAAAELKVLVSPKYRNDKKAFQTFFRETRYEPIIRKAEFLEKLCDILEEAKLKKDIYDYIIDFYRLRGRKQSELSAVGLRLYQILDQKAGIKPKVNAGVYGGVTAGLLAGFRVLRPVIRQSELLTIIMIGILLAVLLGWLIKKIHENYSVLLAQGLAAVILMISQFIVIMFDLYGTAFGTIEDGNSIAAVIFLAAGAWLAIVVFVWAGRTIMRLFRKR